MIETTAEGAAILSLQSRIEQCEAAIESALVTLQGIEPTDAKSEEAPKSTGAMAAIDRCISEMAVLNSRLSTLAEKVGTL